MAKWIGVPAAAVVHDAPAQMEVGVRTSRNSALAIVVNHDARGNQGQVTLRELPFTVRTVTDAVTGKPYPVQAKAGVCTFTVKLPARQALMLKLSPAGR